MGRMHTFQPGVTQSRNELSDSLAEPSGRNKIFIILTALNLLDVPIWYQCYLLKYNLIWFIDISKIWDCEANKDLNMPNDCPD